MRRILCAVLPFAVATLLLGRAGRRELAPRTIRGEPTPPFAPVGPGAVAWSRASERGDTGATDVAEDVAAGEVVEEPEPEEILESGWLDPDSVRIVDAESKAPVQGARAWTIRFHSSLRDGRECRDAVSDERGELCLEAPLGPGACMLVRKRGYVAHYEPIRLGTLPGTVALVPGMPVRGTVVLADGSPATGAQVYAWDAESKQEIVHEAGSVDACFDDSITADAEGRFEIDGVKPGSAFVLAVIFPGCAVYRAVHDAQPEIPIRLGCGGVIEGRVLDKQGLPVPGADVYVEPEPVGDHYTFDIVYWDRINARTVSDVEGRYSIVGITTARRYFVTASKDYQARGASEALDFGGRGDRQWRDVTIERSAALNVRIDDLPENARMRCDLRHLDGSFSWTRFWSNSYRVGDDAYTRDGIDAGTYVLTVSLDGRLLERRIIELRPGETMDITIPAGRP